MFFYFTPLITFASSNLNMPMAAQYELGNNIWLPGLAATDTWLPIL